MAIDASIPVEYAVIGFRGNKFNGEVAPEIYRLADEKIVRIVDVVFISKDKDGGYTALELNDLTDEEYAQFVPLSEHMDPLFTPEDVGSLSQLVPPDCSAMILLWQNMWANRFREAATKAGGELLAYERVPVEVMQEVVAEMEAKQAKV